jgi:hypothetical protein
VLDRGRGQMAVRGCGDPCRSVAPERFVHVCSTRLRHALSENGRQMGRAGAGGIVRRVRIHSFRDFDSMAHKGRQDQRELSGMGPEQDCACGANSLC